jgi:hypothetical protein
LDAGFKLSHGVGSGSGSGSIGSVQETITEIENKKINSPNK